MKTLRLSDSLIDIQKAAQLLRDGQLVAFPTETVYGLGADLFNIDAIQQIYKVKGRPQDNPLIAHVSSVEEILLLSSYISPFAHKLIDAFFPGPLTIVLPRNPTVPGIVSAGHSTIAIRMPNHQVAQTLIKYAKAPLVAPSANLSGKPSPTNIDHVLEDLDGNIAAVIDGGTCRVGIESTVIDMTTSIPIILRPGFITKEAIENVLGVPVEVMQMSVIKEIHAPGMKYRHYAPHATIVVLDVSDIDSHTFTQTILLSNIATLHDNTVITYPLTTQTLYSSFREADHKHIPTVTIILDEETKKDMGIMNRISKAASKK